MKTHLCWRPAGKGGEAEILSIDDDALVVRSTTPAPPGARLEAVIASDPSTPVKMKSHGSKREEDGSFVVRGRLIDAPRALRDRLAALVAEPTVPGQAKPE